jgi:histidinol-phosphatase (PHP family)
MLRGPGYVDLHVHSTCSADGGSSIAEHARRAATLGLAEVGFCEHMDFDPRDHGSFFLDPAGYAREITVARAMVPEVRLRQGVEITYQAYLEAEIRSWLAGWPWDYVVTSVHLVDYADGWTLVSERNASQAYFGTHSQRQSYLPYFEQLLQAARSGLGDVLGHFDLVKRYGVGHYGPLEPADFEEEIRAVLRAAVDGGMGLEINTSGLRQPPGEPYPALAVLRWYHELGGGILTLGSDAHDASYLGVGIVEAMDLAQAAGFGAVAAFEGREVRWIDL